jgi:hypothetical protein
MKPHLLEQGAFPTEEELIHELLVYVITKLPSNRLDEPIDPGDVFIGLNQDYFINFAMHRMVSEGLITTERSRQGRLKYIIRVTPQGIRVAHHIGGYRSYHAEQQNAAKREHQKKLDNERVATQQQEQEREQLLLNRQSVAATISNTRVAKVSAWIAAGSLVIAIVATLIAYRTTADANEIDARLQKLEVQVQQLKRNQTPAL